MGIATFSHSRSECLSACQVRVGVNIFLRLQEHGCDPTATVSDYPSPQGLRSVRASSIIYVIRAQFKQVDAARLGFAPEDVGTHSLRFDRAMAMYIAGILERILMDIGRWHLLGFILYIQQQISLFSTGVLVCVSAQPWFHHL